MHKKIVIDANKPDYLSLDKAMECFRRTEIKPVKPTHLIIRPEIVDHQMGTEIGAAADAAEKGLLRMYQDEDGAMHFYIECEGENVI